MDLLDDDGLTNGTLTLSNSRDGTLVVACGAIAREILAINEILSWDNISIKCLPAIYHNQPEKITPAVIDVVKNNKQKYQKIYVAYADCGTGGMLEKACKDLGVEMIQGPHCYSFFEGNISFAKRLNPTAFFLTDFLARQFDAFVWSPLGLDKHPELIDTYFGNYTKLVYLAQTNDEVLKKKAAECARKLNLEFEYKLTGYGDLKNTFIKWKEAID
ncbi:MAG: DUF1638 domain-containing protein [Rhodobacterales bacterium]|jgi:hypothetical protein|nr:DUF1638 domain-containing protein [Rhodobacterales bacterium]NCX71161.1 DUF1638 domain-containing protein [Paracoccaceae bacterium]